MKKAILWTASALMGLSIFTAPVFNQGNESELNVVHAAEKIQKLPFVKYDDQLFKKGTVVKYSVEVKKEKIVGRLTSFLTFPKGFEANSSFKPKFLVTIKNSKGKVIEKINFDYSAKNQDAYIVAKMPVDTYTIELRALKGIPQNGVKLSSMITGGAMSTKVKHKLHSSLGEYFPTGIPTTITTAHTVHNSFSLSSAIEQQYTQIAPLLLPQKPNENSKFEFKQNRPGIYYLRLAHREETDATHYDMKRFVIFQRVTPQSLKLSIPKKVYKPNEKVVLSGHAKGDYLRYKFTYKVKSTTKEKTVSNFSKTKQATFKAPKEKGDYTVTMFTKQLNSHEIVKTKKVITVK